MKKPLLCIATMALIANNALAQAKECFYPNNSDTSVRDKYELLTTSCNEEIDQAVTQEIQFMRNSFGLNADFFFFDDQDTTATNAFFAAEILNPDFPEGAICVSKNLVNTLCKTTYRPSTMPIIIAHLVGHAIGYKYNATKPDCMNAELFAEFIAGTYLYIRRTYQSTEIESTLSTFEDLSHTDFGDIEKHGLPEQRYYALMAGYNLAKKYFQSHRYFTLQTCIKEGINYVNGYENTLLGKYVGN